MSANMTGPAIPAIPQAVRMLPWIAASWRTPKISDITDSFVFQFLVLAVISCYGGGFSCMPAFLSDIFGVRQLAAIHGSILTAWGIAGIQENPPP